MCCSQCKLNKPIVNKKYNLCDDCNFMRTHDGRTKHEVYSERLLSKPRKVYELKRTPLKQSTKPIKQQTKKEAKVKSQLSELKTSIELDAVQSDMYYCWGCGKSEVGLDKSHILSVKQFKHLELERDNINLYCRQCHLDWESWVIERMGKLLTFEKDLDYIKQYSEEFFSKIVTKMETYIYWNPESPLCTLFSKIIVKYRNKCDL